MDHFGMPFGDPPKREERGADLVIGKELQQAIDIRLHSPRYRIPGMARDPI